MALNALGYTLADRTTRYSEAKALIDKAHQLTPDDPAILDSLGWVNYRLGNLDGLSRTCAGPSPASPTMKWPPTWAKYCGPTASAAKPARSGPRASTPRPTAPSCARPSCA